MNLLNIYGKKSIMTEHDEIF